MRKQRDYTALTLIIGLVILTAFVFVGFFNHPDTDTIGYYNQVSADGLPMTQYVLYRDWTGRFTTNLLMTLAPRIFGLFVLPKILILLTITLFAWACYFLLSSLKQKFDVKLSVSISAAVVFFCFTPGLSDGLFWVAGNLAYVFPVICAILCAGCIINYVHAPHLKWAVLAVFLTFCTSGSNEIAMLDATIFYFLLNIFAYLSSAKHKLFYASLLIAATISVLIVGSAPGNISRVIEIKTNSAIGFDAAGAFAVATSQFLVSLVGWILIALVTSICLYSLGLRVNKYSGKYWSIVIAITLFTAYISFMIPSYILGHTTGRTSINSFVVIMLIGNIYGLWLIERYKRYFPPLNTVSFLTLLVLILFSSNLTQLSSELLAGVPQRYDSYMVNLYSQLKACKSSSAINCSISKLPENAFSTLTIYQLDSPYSDHYNERMVKDYFQLSKPIVFY